MPNKQNNRQDLTNMTVKKRARKRGGPLTPRQRTAAQNRFIVAYAEHGNKTLACEAANISRPTLYEWLEHDEPFSLRAHQAEEMANDVLRAEIKRRAVDGWDEPVYQLGKYAGEVRKYSDTLLIFQAKARMPEYREKVDVTSGGQALLSDLAQTLAAIRSQVITGT